MKMISILFGFPCSNSHPDYSSTESSFSPCHQWIPKFDCPSPINVGMTVSGHFRTQNPLHPHQALLVQVKTIIKVIVLVFLLPVILKFLPLICLKNSLLNLLSNIKITYKNNPKQSILYLVKPQLTLEPLDPNQAFLNPSSTLLTQNPNQHLS